MPKVSVIIPVYNVEKYLAVTMDSVLAQTFNDFEIICVNDGSQDSSGQILEQYRRRDGRIRIITQENQGVSAARNNALKQASGEYVSFFDADDVIHPQFLELMTSAIEKAKTDFIWCDFREIADQEVIQRHPAYPCAPPVQYQSRMFEQFLAKKPNPNVMLWNKLYRFDLIRDISFVPGIRYGEDYIFNFQVMSHAASGSYIPKHLVYYRRRIGSACATLAIDRMIEDRISGFQILMNFFQTKQLGYDLRVALHRRLSKMALKFACLMPKQNDKGHYLIYWNKYAPILENLKTTGIYVPGALTLQNRLKSFLFCHKMFGILKLITR